MPPGFGDEDEDDFPFGFPGMGFPGSGFPGMPPSAAGKMFF